MAGQETPDQTPSPTRLDQEVPPTTLDGGSGGPVPPPPTSLDGAGASSDPQPTTLDESGAAEGGTYVNLPQPLLEDYEALSDMASGGEGDLLLVRHRASGELRVVKIYRGDRRRDERALELLSKADPAHAVVIYDSGQHGGRWWEVMEYCEHGSLTDLIAREGPKLSPERIEQIIREVASALVHVHELKIPHRDLKPANIMIRTLDPDLDLVLADFGLARVLDLSKEMHSRLIISAAYASPQATSSGAISPAMDWWSLGIIVAEIAQGRNPFQQENGEWLADRVIMDWISSRPVDLSGIEDERLANLCHGLTLRDDRHGHRWGAEEVMAWLEGENPDVAAEAEVSTPSRSAASPFPFKDPASGRTRPFTDPAELASALAQDWDAACELLSGSASSRAEQRALRNFLRSLDLAGAEQVLAEQDDVEERLVRLLVELDPQIPPTFRGYSVDRDGLLALARSDGEATKGALATIFSERILLNYARSAGHESLAELDAAWHEEMAAFEQTIDAARSEDGEPILADERERAAASEAARGQVLAGLIDKAEGERLLAEGPEIATDRRPRREQWFKNLADLKRPDGPLGHSLAFLALGSIAVRVSDEREKQEREAREEEERARRAEARARLGKTVALEWWFLVFWNLVWAVTMMGAALALTFAPSHADLVTALKASWYYQWEPLLIAAVITLIATTIYDFLRIRAGKTALAADSFFVDLLLLGIAIPGVFLYSAARDGSVPPSAWSYAPIATAVAFLIATLFRALNDRITARDMFKLTVLALSAAALGVAWLSAPRSDVPSRVQQRITDRHLRAAVPMRHCGARSITALPAGLFRNSIDGLLHCHSGGIRGTFTAFRNRQLMDVYASQKEYAAKHRREGSASQCYNRYGSYTSTWFKNAHRNRELGQFFCYGTGRMATIAWADWRNNVFGSITGRSRHHLYRWWREHSVSPRFRG